MNSPLPESANLEHLKSQAKSLLKSLRSHDTDAVSRVANLPVKDRPTLALAQLAIAREYGFESWAKLKRHVDGYTERRDALFAAIRAGDRERVSAMLRDDRALVASCDPNAFGSTTLNAAVTRDDFGMVDLLIDSGADPNAISSWELGGFRPLDFGTEAIADHLLRRGAILTAHAAARLGRATDLKRIVAADPQSPMSRGGDGQYPLHFAKTPEIVDILLDAGAEIDARDVDHEGTPLQNRILVEPVAWRLVERGATLDAFSATALGEVETLARLLDSDPDALTRRVLEPGNPWVPQAPGRHIYSYNIGDSQLHQVATNLGQRAAYDLLWERSSPKLRLSMAGWRGDREAALETIRQHPETVRQMTEADMRMLPVAAWDRRLETVRLLLKIGFDPNAVRNENMTAAGAAGFHGFDDVVEAILAYKPDLTITNVHGGTPLTACLYGSLHGWRKDGNYPRTVELLIQAGSPMPESAFGSPEALAVLARHGLAT